MRIAELNGKRVAILGYGREGQAMEKALGGLAPGCAFEIRDQRDGPDYLNELDAFDVLIKSPGIPPGNIPANVRARVTNSTQIFLDTVADAGGVLVIGVTGTKGKSTVASLIHAMLKAAGKDAELVGNIGEPAIAHVSCHPEEPPSEASRRKNKFFVQEMSSYQLENMRSSPPVAVITSFFPEHLDYHGPLEAYREAKTNIVRFQKPGDAVLYHDDPAVRRIADASPGKKIPVTAADAPVPVAQTHLLGKHNRANIALAFTTARHLGVPEETAVAAIRAFRGLPHRLQDLGVRRSIRWIDDALSTIPESAAAAIEALGRDTATIIIGGKDRGTDPAPLWRAIARSRICTVIALGETGKHFPEAVAARTMDEAVRIAVARTPEGRTCLLSPGASSYDLFKDYEDKGEQFRQCVESQ